MENVYNWCEEDTTEQGDVCGSPPKAILIRNKNVPKACSECRKSHTKCCNERPCKRCFAKGVDCVDPPRKQRGPRRDYHFLSAYCPDGLQFDEKIIKKLKLEDVVADDSFPMEKKENTKKIKKEHKVELNINNIYNFEELCNFLEKA